MRETSAGSTRIRIAAAVGASLAAGAAAFWTWRERAPLTRTYRQWTDRRERERDGAVPDPTPEETSETGSA